jgi:FkbM family methyltransferase
VLIEDDVLWAYRLYLDREPENKLAIQYALKNYADRKVLVHSLLNSDEYINKFGKIKQNPFWHYACSFAAIETISKYAKKHIKSTHGFITNFLGVKIRPEFLPAILADRAGTIEARPVPANWHADIAEWASCLRSVDLSGDKFIMVELGCGWGCWMVNLGVAAKAAGKKVMLYGVEADQHHLQFARSALGDNSLLAKEFVLMQGIAGKSNSVALFPAIESGINWGGTAVFNPDRKQLKDAVASGKYVQMPVVDIEALVKEEVKLDFMHVDIQGAELQLLTELLDMLCRKVRYVFIGTHSKQIEAGLFDLFLGTGGWKLEMERPAIFGLIDGKPVVTCDEVQAWRNCSFDQ